MGRLTDRLPATEQTPDDPARASRSGGVDVLPEESREPEESRDDALTRLQSTVGNDGMAAAVGGQAPADVVAPLAPPPVPDAGAPVAGAPVAGTPDTAPPTPDAAPVADTGPVLDDEPAPAPDTGADELDLFHHFCFCNHVMTPCRDSFN